MKKASITRITLLLSMIFSLCITASAQTNYHSQVFDIILSGTSNVHDWEMKAVKGNSEVSFVVNDKGIITSLSKLSFTLPTKNLKSDHTGMDKNTYKALKESSNHNISFVGTSAKVTTMGGNNYQFNCEGKMSIAGTTKQTDLIASGKYDPASKSFTITGVKKMRMTDYNVTPPKALLGTIKTGNDISIAYTVTFNN